MFQRFVVLLSMILRVLSRYLRLRREIISKGNDYWNFDKAEEMARKELHGLVDAGKSMLHLVWPLFIVLELWMLVRPVWSSLFLLPSRWSLCCHESDRPSKRPFQSGRRMYQKEHHEAPMNFQFEIRLHHSSITQNVYLEQYWQSGPPVLRGAMQKFCSDWSRVYGRSAPMKLESDLKWCRGMAERSGSNWLGFVPLQESCLLEKIKPRLRTPVLQVQRMDERTDSKIRTQYTNHPDPGRRSDRPKNVSWIVSFVYGHHRH